MKKYFLISLMLMFTIVIHAGIFPTSLKIKVLNSLGNVVEGATVVLYASEMDYRNSENPVQPAQKTDGKGYVKFKDLESKVYFIDAQYEDLDNHGGGEQTDTLQSGLSNRVNVVIQ